MFDVAYLLNFAYAALLSSTYTRTMVRLRIMLIIGAAGFVAYGAIEGIRTMVVWNIVIGSLHGVRLVKALRARRTVTLTADEGEQRDQLFPGLADFDFHVLWSMATVVHYRDEQILTIGERVDAVGLLLSGAVEVRRDGSLVETLEAGSLVGEMSFVSGAPANADVAAVGEVAVREWQQRDLASLDQLQPDAAKAMRQLIGRDLVIKAGRH